MFTKEAKDQIIADVVEACRCLYADDIDDLIVDFVSPCGVTIGKKNVVMWSPLGGFRALKCTPEFRALMIELEDKSGFNRNAMRAAAKEVEVLAQDLSRKATAWRQALEDSGALLEQVSRTTKRADLGQKAAAAAERIRALFSDDEPAAAEVSS